MGPGSILANRYEILELLGEGGMGAVYKARDIELDRIVAVKVIRPDLAGHPEIIQRFKQELILARGISHRNIIRIFDLGIASSTKFITMDFIEGQSLKALVAQEKFAPAQAVEYVRQICLGLEAAHAENVVHRDLKPQNVMVDGHGRICVMDFGLAHSLEHTGMTKTGVLLGTPDYMSPEQAKGEKAGPKSDLFAVGVMFYEMLSGRLPYEGDSMISKLVARTQHPPKPLHELDPAIPKVLSDVVDRCLAIDPAQRFQRAGEIVEALRDWENRTRTVPKPPAERFVKPAVTPVPVEKKKTGVTRLHVLRGIQVALILFLGYMTISRFLGNRTADAPTTGPVTLLVADFANESGDPTLSRSIEPAFSLALEGAKFVDTYDRGQARETAAQVNGGSTELNSSAAKAVALHDGVKILVTGSIRRQGDDYILHAKAVDTGTDQTLAENEVRSDKNGVLAAATKLAVPIRTALGDSTSEATQLSALDAVTAASASAAQEFARGQEAYQAGRNDESIAHFAKAIESDPNLARAYAGMALSQLSAGNKAKAQEYFNTALSKMDHMTERERYRSRGLYYLHSGNYAQAIQELSELVKRYPADAQGRVNLAMALGKHHEMSRAQSESARAVQMLPKDAALLSSSALFSLYAGDFNTAMADASKAIEMSPKAAGAYITRGASSLAKDKPEAASADYDKARSVSAAGASLAAAADADQALYEGRARKALAALEPAIKADLAAGAKTSAARKLLAAAEADMEVAGGRAAMARIDQALQTSKQDNIVFAAARLLVDLDPKKAKALEAELAASGQTESQAHAQIVQGELMLKSGDARDALKAFTQAKSLSDSWLVHFDMGRAYLATKAYVEASSEFEVCLSRRGEAAVLYLDGVPTLRYLAPVYYYLGEAQRGMGSGGAQKSFATYVTLKSKGGEDSLLASARAKAAK